MNGIDLKLAAKLAAQGSADAEIDRVAAGGKKSWKVREVSYVARRDAGLIPNRTGLFARIEDVRASDVREVAKVAPTLRRYAFPIVFGFAPTRANVERLDALSKVVAKRYVGRGRPAAATLAARTAK